MQRRVLGRAALLLGSLVVGLLAAEWLARATWPFASSSRATTDAKLPVLDDLSDLAKPNVRGLNRGVLYRTNSHALRGPEWKRDPADGVFRIVVTGDSTSMGAGIPESDRYSDQLERLLNADSASRRYQVINTALSGLNVEQGVNRLEQALRHYRADLFVFGTSRNDIEGKRYEVLDDQRGANSWWAWAGSHANSASYFWRLLSYRIAQQRGRGAQAAKRKEILHNYFENPKAWGDFAAGLDQFARLAGRHGVCAHVLVLVYLDDLGPGHPERVIYDRVEQAASVRRLAVTQSFPYFEGRSAESLWVSPFDPHPNREGHALLAKALQDGLSELPAKCWETGRRQSHSM